MPLQQSTPPSTRKRWQGTRAAFIDLVDSVARSMSDAAGSAVTGLVVGTGHYEGTLSSTQELRTELTESRWLGAGRITVSLTAADWKDVSASLVLETFGSALRVVYHGGTPQTRETLRAVVERTLPPEPPDPGRRWRWVGAIVGCLFYATLLLILTRIPPIRGSNLRVSNTVSDALVAVGFASSIAVGTTSTWLVYQRWFPSLERLPDTGTSRWDRRRAWVQVALGLWVSLVAIVLALPVRHSI